MASGMPLIMGGTGSDTGLPPILSPQGGGVLDLFRNPDTFASMAMIAKGLNPWSSIDPQRMMEQAQKEKDSNASKSAMELALTQAGMDPMMAKILGANPEAAKLAIAQRQQQSQQAADSSAWSSLLPQTASQPSPATAAPTAAPDISQPRGIRNNNPLNIESGPFTQSQPGYSGSDGRFAKFASADQGIAAADNLLNTYGTKYGLNTVAGIVGRWAPASDGNPVSAYAKSVSDELGVKPTDPIDINNPSVRQKLVQAMGKFENGRPIGGSTSPVMAQGSDPSTTQAVPSPGTTIQSGRSSGPTPDQILAQLRNPNLSTTSRTTLLALYNKALDDQGLTPEMKNYNGYVRQETGAGRTPLSFMDYGLAKAKAGAQSITVDQRGENEEAKALGKQAGERAGEMYKSVSAAGKGLQNLSRTETLLNQVQQGKVEPTRLTISAWARSMGLNDDVATSLGLNPKDVGNSQALQSLLNESVLGKIGTGQFPSNNFSDADRAFLVDTLPKIGNDPRANKILIETARRAYQMDIDKGKSYAAFRSNPDNKGKSFNDFEIEWNDKLAQQDRFGDLRKQAEGIVGAANAPPTSVSPPAATQPASATSPQQSPNNGATRSGIQWSVQ